MKYYMFIVIGMITMGAPVYLQASNYALVSQSNKLLYALSYPTEAEGFALLQENLNDFIDRTLRETRSEQIAKKKAQDFIFEHMKNHFIQVLRQIMEEGQDIKKCPDPIVQYIVKYRFGFLSRYLSHLTEEKIMLEDDPVDGQVYTTLLHIAAQYRADKIVKFLIECGGNLNVFDSYGASPLHDAVMNNAVHGVKILLDAPKVVKNAKINLNIQDAVFGRTPLHFAVEYNFKDIVKILLDAGADFRILDKDGKTAEDFIGFDAKYYPDQVAQESMYKLLHSARGIKK